jgi:hypothetical protein
MSTITPIVKVNTLSGANAMVDPRPPAERFTASQVPKSGLDAAGVPCPAAMPPRTNWKKPIHAREPIRTLPPEKPSA